MATFSAGFDLGGTKMLCRILDVRGKIVGGSKEPTGAADTQDRLVQGILACLEMALADAGIHQSDLACAGFGVPGPVNVRDRLILELPNLGLKKVPLGDILEKKLGIPVWLENDVNAGVYGEFRKGAGMGYEHIVGLFPGTGLGGGMVLGGELYRGAFGGAGELGHMIIEKDGRMCGCGRKGCLEAYASRTAIAKDLAVLAATGKSPTVLKEAGADIRRIKSGVIQKAIKAREPEVLQVVERSAQMLGLGMASCVHIFNPQILVLGGGLVEKLGSWYCKIAEKAMRQAAFGYLADMVQVVPARLGDDAVALGAALLAEEYRSSRT